MCAPYREPAPAPTRRGASQHRLKKIKINKPSRFLHLYIGVPSFGNRDVKLCFFFQLDTFYSKHSLWDIWLNL